jgi:hypothetical protein
MFYLIDTLRKILPILQSVVLRLACGLGQRLIQVGDQIVSIFGAD